MKLKRLIAGLLLSSIVTAAVSCSGEGDGTDTSSENVSGTTETTSSVTGTAETTETTTAVTTEAPEDEIKFAVTPEKDGIMFVNHQENKRSGHIGHAMVEYEENKILAFYSNDNGTLNMGHNNYGWVEYKRSVDGGETWSEPIILDYSMKCYEEGSALICCEKAIVTDTGKIVLFCYRGFHGTQSFGPMLEPTFLTSTDGGETWSQEKFFCDFPGRVWDAIYKDGVIYVLMQREYYYIKYPGDGAPSHILYTSTDDGESFQMQTVITYGKGDRYNYGTMIFTPEEKLIVYFYDYQDEYNMLYFISNDNGKSFTNAGRSYCAKRIRNPQVIYLNGLYFLHGRSGDNGEPNDFVLYMSKDGITWDEGRVIRICDGMGGCSYYSNSIVVGGNRILIQASDAYIQGKVNIKHWWIDFVE